MTSCTFAYRHPQLRINLFRYVHGDYLMLILYWMRQCHWIHVKQFLSVVFHGHWKLVSIFVPFLCLFISTILNENINFIFQFFFFLFLVELAMIMDRLYGGVCYAGIDTDPELKYPKVNNLINIYCWHFLINHLFSFSMKFKGCWTCCIFKPTKLYCCHFGTLCSIAAWWYWQARRSKAIRSWWPDVWRMPRSTLQWQICTILLCKCYVLTSKSNCSLFSPKNPQIVWLIYW